MSFDLPMKREALTNKLREEVRTAVARVLADNIATSSCISCVFFNEPNEECKRFGGRPPARVIAFGCPGYMDNFDVPY